MNYLFLLPGLLFFLVFFAGPAVAGVVLGFFSWGPLDSPAYVGFANYSTLFGDPAFWHSFKVTLIVVGLALVTQLPTAIGLAVLMSRTGPMMTVARVALFLPNVMSMVAVALLWKELFDPNDGLANSFLELFGLGPYGWLGDPSMALWTIMLVVLWTYVGFHTIIQLSGLAAIPQELLDAARLDTRSAWQVFTRVTLPLMRESIAISAVLIVTSSFAFLTSLFFVMTKGGPARATEILGIRAYYEAFQSLNLGMANAITSVTVVLTLGLVGAFLWLAARSRLEY